MKYKFSQTLYIQVLFTILAFTAMVILSYFYMRGIVHESLVRKTESVFSFTQAQLESDLNEPRLLLGSFAHAARSMILHGDSIETLNHFINDVAKYVSSSKSSIMKSIVVYGYFEAFDEPIFISSRGAPPEGYDPLVQDWFRLASTNCSVIMETPLYESVISGSTVISYTRCIHADDEEHTRLGIIGVSISTEHLGDNIVNIAMAQGGYGTLIGQDLRVIAHQNQDYKGIHVTDPSVTVSVFADDFIAGRDIIERSLINGLGEETVAFFRKMSNGWYLGLLTPEAPFYQSIKTMALTLIMLGALLAFILICILIRIDMARHKSTRESKHKSAFLANMSHEIRTPMNAIIGMTTIGKSSSDPKQKDSCFSKIQQASDHLLGVINDILDMSKIEANKFELSPAEFNFEKMLQRVVNVVNFRIDEKHQNFSVYIDREIPKTLIGDDHRIAQVVTNLLGNAIKFTPEEGSIHLDARLTEEHDGFSTIQISVTDTGIGMTLDQQGRIFNSFEQAETSTTRKYGGTGLGLPISKSIVEMMGGRIWVDSDPEKGSTFTFNVKLKSGEKSHRGLLAADVNISNVRIMVVDDDKNVLNYFEEISHEFNVKCDTAQSGKEALELLEKNGFYHIYFIDWRMPEMDGIQLTAKLKELHQSVKSVVIMITAAEWMAVEKEAREAGVEKFLSKPLFPSHVADVINEALGVDRKRVEECKECINGIFAGRNILLAEDIEINREIVTALLEPTQIHMDWAENGKEAVQMFSENPDKYDMILMDVQMPEMDGYEATRRIRALDVAQSESVPIIAMTANVFQEDIGRCIEAGMDDHLGKPLDFNEVMEKIQQYI